MIWRCSLVLFLLCSCRPDEPELNSLIIENRSSNAETGMADLLYVLPPGAEPFYFYREKPPSFKELGKHTMELKKSDTKTSSVLLILKGASDQEVNKLNSYQYDYAFIQEANQKLFKAIDKLNIKRAIFCLGRIPAVQNSKIKKRILVVPSRIFRDIIDIPRKGKPSIFFFSNRDKYIG